MAVRSRIHEKDGLFYITITCARWIKLFEFVNGYHVVYKWFDHLKSQGHYITAYVIMPNHLHALIGFRNTNKSINTIVGNGKRFMAYQLVKLLKELKHTNVLEELQSIANKTDRQRGKLHEVFEPSFDWKECIHEKFIEQKLDYIHDNPCQENWKLVADSVDYIHSSARYYDTGEQGIYPVISYTELEDIDLSGELDGTSE